MKQELCATRQYRELPDHVLPASTHHDLVNVSLMGRLSLRERAGLLSQQMRS